MSSSERELERRAKHKLADRLGAKPGLALLAHAAEMQSIFVLARIDSLTDAADDPAAKWITRKSGEVGLQLSYSRLQRAGLLADPRIAGFEFDFKLKTNPFSL